nr:hypothetical protein GCM10025699_44830 [Microbacterium flavescens]
MGERAGVGGDGEADGDGHPPIVPHPAALGSRSRSAALLSCRRIVAALAPPARRRLHTPAAHTPRHPGDQRPRAHECGVTEPARTGAESATGRRQLHTPAAHTPRHACDERPRTQECGVTDRARTGAELPAGGTGAESATGRRQLHTPAAHTPRHACDERPRARECGVADRARTGAELATARTGAELGRPGVGNSARLPHAPRETPATDGCGRKSAELPTGGAEEGCGVTDQARTGAVLPTGRARVRYYQAGVGNSTLLPQTPRDTRATNGRGRRAQELPTAWRADESVDGTRHTGHGRRRPGSGGTAPVWGGRGPTAGTTKAAPLESGTACRDDRVIETGA